MKRRSVVALLAFGFAALAYSPQASSETGWVSLFDGKDMNSFNQIGDSNWRVEDGAIIGSQDMPGNGGLIITDKQYGDFEVVLEMRNDFGPDSGLFLRSTEDGKAYQAMIDYHVGGNLMGIYGEGIGGFSSRNFTFTDPKDPSKIKEDQCPFPLPVSPEKWPAFWKHSPVYSEWSELKARIVGNPPSITTWIKGVKFMEYTDTKKRLGDTGGIALQVHGGSYGGPGDLTKLVVRYRNIRVKTL